MKLLHCIFPFLLAAARAQEAPSTPARDADLRAHLVYRSSANRPMGHMQSAAPAPAVLWLVPAAPKMDEVLAAWKPRAGSSLVQKHRMFTPHLLVVPPGTVVSFPNQDPFFHNVFSLFEGKRFNLGLYEAGATRAVTFSRPGPSYIFCNIHPEMSAVVLVLPTPYFSIADAQGGFDIKGLPPGEYELHLWAEGVAETETDKFKRMVHLSPGTKNLGQFDLQMPTQTATHMNLYGKRYEQIPPNSYLP